MPNNTPPSSDTVSAQLRREATKRAARKAAAAATGGASETVLRLWPLLKWVVVGVVASMLGLFVLIIMLGAAQAEAPQRALWRSLGIPEPALRAYMAGEAHATATFGDSCILDWPVIAGIYRVESVHGTIGGREIPTNGKITPPIIGVPLDGTSGVAYIADTDNGVWDGDTVYDRAVGPGQFTPQGWRAHGVDGNGDGVVDPQNIYDSALATVEHLCRRTPGNFVKSPQALRAALLGYNQSERYATEVTGWITFYRAFNPDANLELLTNDGLYAFPVGKDLVTIEQIRANHHDYPAWDVSLAEGTPVHAVAGGVIDVITYDCPTPESCRCGNGIVISGFDGFSYVYCHASELVAGVTAGTPVVAGQLLMASGDTGNSSGPHLHLGIRNPVGVSVCPQVPVEAWYLGLSVSPEIAPLWGCVG